ncbi:hypothetical protein SAMN05192529_101372 [Arachidicoccus rhizosphaerae]|uniref:Uncharacterized protein n=1 Tax=Arachidicoccus rhizosphaerae TaxID=551991 RepID=A0A1H3VSM3_9BACT|nr:hypothetical protein SAMN05192529_101372 [Arachidicoccus rhizosphaerae]
MRDLAANKKIRSIENSSIVNTRPYFHHLKDVWVPLCTLTSIDKTILY